MLHPYLRSLVAGALPSSNQRAPRRSPTLAREGGRGRVATNLAGCQSRRPPRQRPPPPGRYHRELAAETAEEARAELRTEAGRWEGKGGDDAGRTRREAKGKEVGQRRGGREDEGAEMRGRMGDFTWITLGHLPPQHLYPQSELSVRKKS